MKTVVSNDGTVIAHETGGSGPNLVLVHGTTENGARWRPVRPALERQFTVVTIDRRGRGSSGDADDYAFEREADDILAVVAALDGPVVVFGHSFGAVCALQAATRSGRLAGLILYEPPIMQEIGPDAVVQMDALLANGDGEGVVNHFMRNVVGVPDDILPKVRMAPAWTGRVAAAHTLPRELKALHTHRLTRERLAGVSMPVLLLRGGESAPSYAAASDWLAGSLPDTRTVVMPGQGHVAMDTGPDLVVGAVLDFARDLGLTR